MNKQQYEEWVIKAEEALQNSGLFKDAAHQKIHKSYNGYIAALGVSILMIGLVPTLAIYYQDNEDVCRKKVLDVVAHMIEMESSKVLLKTAIDSNSVERAELQKRIMESSIALKQVVRTYELVDDEQKEYM